MISIPNKKPTKKNYQQFVMTNLSICRRNNLCLFCKKKLKLQRIKGMEISGYMEIKCHFNGAIKGYTDNMPYCSNCEFKLERELLELLKKEWNYKELDKVIISIQKN